MTRKETNEWETKDCAEPQPKVCVLPRSELKEQGIYTHLSTDLNLCCRQNAEDFLAVAAKTLLNFKRGRSC